MNGERLWDVLHFSRDEDSGHLWIVSGSVKFGKEYTARGYTLKDAVSTLYWKADNIPGSLDMREERNRATIAAACARLLRKFPV